VIGYAVSPTPELASFRLRVALPAAHLGMDYAIGAPGDVTFMYKLGDPDLARQCGPVVFDVVNDHFERYASVVEMCRIAHTITAGSRLMAARVRQATGREALVIDDPYEDAEGHVACDGDHVAWFGHLVNLPSLNRYGLKDAGLKLRICTNYAAPGIVPWSRSGELSMIQDAAVVLLTGTNPGASSNRVVKALRVGRFVVAPEDCAESWREFSDFIWIGDVLEGIRWAFSNRGEACRKVRAGQQAIRQRFSPRLIGSQWAGLFGSIMERGTSTMRAG
jgi:hypothetical protein